MTEASETPLQIPAPFRSALEGGDLAAAGNAAAESPEALHGRGLVRILLGDDRGAREDLSKAEKSLGDVSTIELVYLDLRTSRNLETCVTAAAAVASNAGMGSTLRARALHVGGHACGKLRDTGKALEALLEAEGIYRQLGERKKRAWVQDTLGMVFAARGQLEQALGYYSLSLAQKTLAGDEYGMALSLGNMGRVHQRAGRFADALDCFRLDAEIAERIGDRRGQARMRNDIGRTLLARGEATEAEEELRCCLQIAEAEGSPDITFFAHKDLALVHLFLDRLEESHAELKLAEAALEAFSAPYAKAILLAARGEWKLRAGHADALELMESAVRGFRKADLPDLEIPALIKLADAHLDRGSSGPAEDCLRTALARARADGYARYLPDIREAMGRLSVLEPMDGNETGRLTDVTVGAQSPDGYTIMKRLGGGGFGSVFKAFDPRRARLVAIKLIEPRPENRMDGSVWRNLLISARMELEAASRIRHPGVARVHAVGRDTDDRTYVVQDFIDGQNLKDHMVGRKWSSLLEPLRLMRDIAFAVEELHTHGVLHRDLKPANIMIRAADGSPVLVDFGLAHVLEGDGMNAPLILGGTRSYMSPEQMRCDPVNDRADIYSLGIVYRVILTGDPLWRLSESGRGFAPGIVELVDGMTAHHHSHRPAAGAVIASLSEILEDPAALIAPSDATTIEEDDSTFFRMET